jgi:hypothetical protein
VLFQLRPDVLRRVQFRRVRWQIVDLDLSVQCLDVLVNQPAAMSGQSIPDQQHRTVDLLPEVLDEIEDFFFTHGSRVQAEVKLPRSNAGGDGEVIPIELVLEDRRDAPPRPGADSVWALAKPALVYEDNDAPLFLGFFLSTGQIFSFQSRMANSFRSRARPTGRWQLHPNFLRRIHHTCPG